MICPSCGNENPDEAKFCMQCGTSLIQHCVNCQAELPPTARFCMQCGQAVEEEEPKPLTEIGAPALAVQLAGERRVVTVMFADISGFTAMSERMDPEQVRSLMNACFDRLVPIVEKYGGVVDKFIGDEIMALYGAPIAHEDDTARALHTALEMMNALDQFNQKHGTQLGVHMGINTGLVVAGGIGSQGRQQYSVMGDTVNLAARLEGASERGEILVGPNTYQRAAPLFEFETLDPIRVKGKAQPVQIYQLLRAKSQPGPLRGLIKLDIGSAMVGRDSELQTLQQVSRAVRSGGGRVVVLIGEPGLGKTRLLHEWQAAESEAMRWITGQCLSYGQGLAYHLLINLLHAWLGVPSGAAAADVHTALRQQLDSLFNGATDEVYPYLGHLLSLPLSEEAQVQVQRFDPQALQNKYLAALHQLILALAAQRPLGLILEDIHWADPSSTELLTKVINLTAESPVLFCCATRPETDVPGWQLVTSVRHTLAERVTEINLRTLSEKESQQLVANLLAIDSLPSEVRTLILKRSEGNPLFVEEVIRMLVDREVIKQADGRWVVNELIEQIDIPDNLQGLLLARIDRLPDDVKHTLRVASVIGRQFSVRVLEEVLKNI